MNKTSMSYEPPKMKVYRFDENDRILTESGIMNPPDPTQPSADYAARALNDFMGATNTTIEKNN